MIERVMEWAPIYSQNQGSPKKDLLPPLYSPHCGVVELLVVAPEATGV